MQHYHSIYVQIAWIVEAEIGCYCGALDLIDFSVFSIMRPPAATSSKRETSLLYLGAALIQHPRQHFLLKSGRSGCHTLKHTTGNDRRGISRMQLTLFSRTGFKYDMYFTQHYAWTPRYYLHPPPPCFPFSHYHTHETVV